MDAYVVVVAILVLLLTIYLFYNFSYSNGFGPNNNTLNQPFTQAKESEEASKRKVKMENESTQSIIAATKEEVSQTVSDTEEIESEEPDEKVDDNCDAANETQTADGTWVVINKADTAEQEDDDAEINTFRSFINKDELNKCMAVEGVFDGLCSYIKNSLNTWKEKKLEIAIAGNSGTGKSSLINSLRDLKASDKGAAAVGVTETTTNIVRCIFPNTDRIFISDLPGMGTVKFPRKNYVKEMKISTYDAFIIVTSGRITQNDVWFVRHVLHGSNPKHVLFVRTKIDADLFNAESDHPSSFDRDKCLSDIREDICSNFKDKDFKGFLENIYLISSRHKDQFDFLKLKSNLKNILNTSGRSIRKLLEKEVNCFIEEKRDRNKREFFGRKVFALFSGIIPFPDYFNIFPSLLWEGIPTICKSKFEINDKFILKVANEIGKNVEDLKSNMETFKHAGEPLLKSSWNIWGVREYDKIQINLSKFCDQMCEDEKYLVKLKLYALEEDLRPLK